jgi:hypothetical protein
MKSRTIGLTSPLMHGGDVLLLQRTVNNWLRRWHVPRLIDEDGEYGPESRRMTLLVCYGLGIQAEAGKGIAPDVRLKLRDPARRTLVERRRGAGRESWRHRLKQRFQQSGPALAVAYATRVDGVCEYPPGSNRGPQIDAWNRMVGTPPGPQAYWCGAFCNACLVAAGFRPMSFMAYCPSIEQHARAGVDGWRWFDKNAVPRMGWLALFTHGGVAGHVELVARTGRPMVTFGGNTSRGDGSPNNGGVVCRHDWSHYRGLPLRGFAAPPYHH